MSVRVHIVHAVDVLDPKVQYVRFLLHADFRRHHLLPYGINALTYFGFISLTFNF